MQSHSSACPCRILRVALHSPHLPLILSIVPFPRETTDSRAVAYYSPVPRTPLTFSPRAVSRSEVSQKMIAPPAPRRATVAKREREYERGNSDMRGLAHLHLPSRATHHYTHVLSRNQIDCKCNVHKQTAKCTYNSI